MSVFILERAIPLTRGSLQFIFREHKRGQAAWSSKYRLISLIYALLHKQTCTQI